jgi:EAL domain-containing protein (putative c-di-GMP-specific phosphodiesterase class I)
MDQLDRLSGLGCDYGQGYYFSKPVGAQTTQALMQDRNELASAFAKLQRSADSEDTLLTENIPSAEEVAV